MARLPNVYDFNESIRKKELESLSFNNKHGDKLVITPKELQHHLQEFILGEINSHNDETVRLNAEALERKIKVKLDQLEFQLLSYIENRVDTITERIVSGTIERVIEAKVNKRFNEKLQKLKESL